MEIQLPVEVPKDTPQGPSPVPAWVAIPEIPGGGTFVLPTAPQELCLRQKADIPIPEGSVLCVRLGDGQSFLLPGEGLVIPVPYKAVPEAMTCR